MSIMTFRKIMKRKKSCTVSQTINFKLMKDVISVCKWQQENDTVLPVVNVEIQV